MGCSHQGSEVEIPPVGDRRTASKQGEGVRPHRGESSRQRDRRRFSSGIAADLPNPAFTTRTFCGADFTIGTRHDHVIGIGLRGAIHETRRPTERASTRCQSRSPRGVKPAGLGYSGPFGAQIDPA